MLGFPVSRFGFRYVGLQAQGLRVIHVGVRAHTGDG